MYEREKWWVDEEFVKRNDSIAKSMKGQKRTDEQKERMRIAQIGSEKVFQLNLRRKLETLLKGEKGENYLKKQKEKCPNQRKRKEWR